MIVEYNFCGVEKLSILAFPFFLSVVFFLYLHFHCLNSFTGFPLKKQLNHVEFDLIEFNKRNLECDVIFFLNLNALLTPFFETYIIFLGIDLFIEMSSLFIPL